MACSASLRDCARVAVGRSLLLLRTDTKILVTRTELEFASGLPGRLRGYVANTYWPAWFQPTVLELEPEPFGPFAASTALTR